jgi:hypothetical protein
MKYPHVGEIPIISKGKLHEPTMDFHEDPGSPGGSPEIQGLCRCCAQSGCKDDPPIIYKQ